MLMVPILTDVVREGNYRGDIMNAVDDLGYVVENVPITEVRVIFHRGKWYVEYRKAIGKDAGWFNHLWNHLMSFWWFDDSTHSNYSDAAVRATVLQSTGYFEKLVKKNKFVLSVPNKK